MSGPVHEPGAFNIETWDGRQWRGGMNRLSEAGAIAAAQLWAEETGRRYRVFDLEGRVVFDSEETGAIADPGDWRARTARAYRLQGEALREQAAASDSVAAESRRPSPSADRLREIARQYDSMADVLDAEIEAGTRAKAATQEVAAWPA